MSPCWLNSISLRRLRTVYLLPVFIDGLLWIQQGTFISLYAMKMEGKFPLSSTHFYITKEVCQVRHLLWGVCVLQQKLASLEYNNQQWKPTIKLVQCYSGSVSSEKIENEWSFTFRPTSCIYRLSIINHHPIKNTVLEIFTLFWVNMLECVLWVFFFTYKKMQCLINAMLIVNVLIWLWKR